MKKETRILNVDVTGLTVEKRSDGEPRTIAGYAAVFNKDSEDMGFVERIAPGAFKTALKTSDVRALVNHDPNLLLGRTESKTLRLTENARGLKFELDLPDTQAARDAAESIRRGDMTGCSFSFDLLPDGATWKDEEGEVRRELTKIRTLFDVGPVTFPAYPDTTVAARAFGALRAAETQPADEIPEPQTLEQEHRKRLAEAEAQEKADAHAALDARMKRARETVDQNIARHLQ